MAGWTIPLMKNAFLEEQQTREALAGFISRPGQLSMGPKCAAFEDAFSRRQGCRHAVLFSSGGAANLAMMQACKNLGLLADGAVVGFSAVTWATNVMPILQLGMRALPVDCSRRTLNVMSENLEASLEEADISAMFITNALGFAGDLPEIRRLCDERGILLLEDNCESLGTELPEGRTGNFGLGSSFSFFVAHHMSTIEGGMVCTDDDDFCEMLKIVRANGWDRNLEPARQKSLRQANAVDGFKAQYCFYELGFNLRPTEITGFIGLEQLKHLEEANRTRQRRYMAFAALQAENEHFLPVKSAHLSFVSNFALPVVCRTPELQNFYVQKFIDAGVEVRPLIAGNMQNQPFYRKYIQKTYELSGADFLEANAFYCGNCPDYTDEEFERICSVISS